jgi:hypothetical protein
MPSYVPPEPSIQEECSLGPYVPPEPSVQLAIHGIPSCVSQDVVLDATCARLAPHHRSVMRFLKDKRGKIMKTPSSKGGVDY